MSLAGECAAAEVRRVLEAAPFPLAQRGGGGAAQIPGVTWNPSLHPRGTHGQFAAGQGQQPYQTTPQQAAANRASQAAAVKLLAQQRATQAKKGQSASSKANAAKGRAKGQRIARSKGGGVRGKGSKGTAASKQQSLSAAVAAAVAGSAWHTPVNPNGPANPHQLATLQTKLQSLGYDLGAKGITGTMTPGTAAALKTFQQHNGIPADGQAGPATINLLNLLGQREAFRKSMLTALGMTPPMDVASQTLSTPFQGKGRQMQRALSLDTATAGM